MTHVTLTVDDTAFPHGCQGLGIGSGGHEGKKKKRRRGRRKGRERERIGEILVASRFYRRFLINILASSLL